MNKLSASLSPYLKQHADNPVHWIPWDETVLMRARLEHKAILVSIGYSTCHWCHVMAHESFEDPLTAEIMNDHFICVKIDREERPDLDHFFMNAVQAMGISGGWPLHCFLNDEGKPFFGGTYFPPKPKYGRPSWSQVLISVSQAYKDKSRELAEQADHLLWHLNKNQRIEQPERNHTHELDPQQLYTALQSSFDLLNGGFGTAPKFPHTTTLNLLFYLYFRINEEGAKNHSLHSLRQMALGGIYDHIDGGFCRYSVDGSWDVPHFEKMLYDHAQILESLSTAFTLSKDVFYKETADRSIGFFERQMCPESGLYFAALDADTDGEEGKYYVWETEELASLLNKDYDSFLELYELKSLDQFHPNKKVIRLKTLKQYGAEWITKLNKQREHLQTLKAARSERRFPGIDTKIIIAWNAMMVNAYAKWYRATGEMSYFIKAKETLDKLLEKGTDNDGYLCRYLIDGIRMGHGFLEDYAYMIQGCLEVYQLNFEMTYLDKAFALFELVEKEFTIENHPLYRSSPKAYNDFPFETVDWTESSYPSAISILCKSMRYIGELKHNDGIRKRLNEIFNLVRASAHQFPLSMSFWSQEILEFESGGIVLKTSDPHMAIRNMIGFHLPGLMTIPVSETEDGMVFCFNGQCHLAIFDRDKIVPLFSAFKIQ